MLTFSFKFYTLQLKNVFRISQGARDSAPLVFTRIGFQGFEGYGEGSMPPLYGESRESARAFLTQVDLSQFTDPFDTERSPLPVIGDEGVQRLDSLKEAASIYHGINIKLMKSTGLREGFKMAITAKALGMKVMLGCMSESSLAISAAAQLSALADWIDLDGNLDAANDPFHGVVPTEGLIAPCNIPGLGVKFREKEFFNQLP